MPDDGRRRIFGKGRRKNETALSGFDVLPFGAFFLEIMPQGIDKATSLQQLLDLLGYQREDLAGCGDGFNDLTMIQFAGLGVAMENAQEPVKQAADFITHSNDMDGIAHMISVCFQ